MCIVLATTAHPEYALIVLDNRDEFIARPTSRPHWWSQASSSQEVLSSRDLQRAEQGTWMGVTRSGNFAVLTNYKEDVEGGPQGQRSRGGMVTSWLTADSMESTKEFVHRLLSGEGVKGVGGFSLLCGKLRKNMQESADAALEPLAIISNRAGSTEDVPWIGADRGAIYGLSNTSYDDPVAWPKVELGKELLLDIVEKATSSPTPLDKQDLMERLFELLKKDTLPEKKEEETFAQYTYQLRKSIFIPAFGKPDPVQASADRIAAANISPHDNWADSAVQADEHPHQFSMTGVYGTQRQTIMLVDWDGNVTMKERALWSDDGDAIPSGKGDIEFNFQIEGWADVGDHGIHASHM